MLRIVPCSLLQVQLQYSLGRMSSSSLSSQLCVCLSVPPISFTQQSSTCRGGKKFKISTWRLCRAVRSGQQTLVLAMQSTEPVLGKQVLTELQLPGLALHWGGDLHPWEEGNDATRARKGWQARHTAAEWDLLWDQPGSGMGAAERDRAPALLCPPSLSCLCSAALCLGYFCFDSALKLPWLKLCLYCFQSAEASLNVSKR